MSSLVKVFITSLVFFASTAVFATAEFANVKEAKEQIDQYKALRRACMITKAEQRKVCFSELNAATGQYKKAKEYLAVSGGAGSAPLIGQAQ